MTEIDDILRAIHESRRDSEGDKMVLERIGDLLEDISAAIGATKNELKSAMHTVTDLTRPWEEADDAASKYAKSVGLAAKGMDNLRSYTIDNLTGSLFGDQLAFLYDVSIPELIQMQQKYVTSAQRNIAISRDMQENMAAMNAVMGEGAAELLTSYEKMGVSVNATAKHSGEMFANASKFGINASVYSKNVASNISIAQNYTFKNGLKGLESMAAKATALKLDMKQVAAFAEKVSTVEGSIDTSAQLQVLGGPFASMADPMGMLEEGLNDIEGLQDRLTTMVGKLGTFNKRTGEVEVSAFNKQRIKASAKAMGLSSEQMMDMINSSARINEVDKQLAASATGSRLTPEMKKLIENSASFDENGKAGVIDSEGNFKTVDQLTESDYGDLVKATQSDSENIRDIAQNLRSLKNMRSGFEKQTEAWQAWSFSWMGSMLKNTIKIVGTIGLIYLARVGIRGIQGFLKFHGSVLRAFPKGLRYFKNALNRFFGSSGPSAPNTIRNSFGKVKNIFKGGSSAANPISNSAEQAVGQTAKQIARNRNIVTARNAIKGGPKSFLKYAGKLGKVSKIAKGSGVLAGAVEGIMTGIDEFGGENNHSTARKVGTTAGAATGGGLGAWGGASMGAAIGTAILPGIGTAIGGALGGIAGGIAGSKFGKWVGSGFADDEGRKKLKDKFGLTDSLQGDYSKNEIKEINRAKTTGELSDKLKKELLDNGDSQIVQDIEKIKSKKDKEKAKTEIPKQNIKEATIYITNAKFANMNGNGQITSSKSVLATKMMEMTKEIGSSAFNNARKSALFKTLGNIDPTSALGLGNAELIKRGIEHVTNIKGKLEDGLSSTWEKIKPSVGNNAGFNNNDNLSNLNGGNITVTINGSLKLTGDKGDSVDIIKYLKNNPSLQTELAQMISKEIYRNSKQSYGGVDKNYKGK